MRGKRAKAIRALADEVMARRHQRRFTTYVEIDHGPAIMNISSGPVPVFATVDRIQILATGWRRLYRNLKRDYKRARTQGVLP